MELKIDRIFWVRASKYPETKCSVVQNTSFQSLSVQASSRPESMRPESKHPGVQGPSV